MSDSIKTISLFSGCGGIDVGFKKAGFKIIFANDNWDDACETLQLNEIAEAVECRDVRELDYKRISSDLKIRKFDCLIVSISIMMLSIFLFILINILIKYIINFINILIKYK